MEYFSRVLAASRRLRLFLPNHDDHLPPRAPIPAVDLGLGQSAMAEVASVPCSQGVLSSSGRGASDVRIDMPQRLSNGYRWSWQRSCATYARLPARVGIIVPIHRLPFQLLARIFEFTVVPDRHRMEYRMEHSGGYTHCIPLVDLICVTHVCRLWRDVALATPSLWSGINDCNRTRLDTIRSRSQSASLSYEICWVNDPYIAQLLQDDASRVRQLNICQPPGNEWQYQIFHVPSTLQFDGSFLEGIRMAPFCISDRLPENIDQSTWTRMLFGQAMLSLKLRLWSSSPT